MSTQPTVNWDTYAQTYDMLLAYNPFYQQLHKEVMARTFHWFLPTGAVIADVGAGTGNYSVALAKQFPEATVLHIDNDPGMNDQARKKAQEKLLDNHHIIDLPIEQVQHKSASIHALVSIHALYTFPDPQAELRKMYNWLVPRGEAILVNAGRIVNVLDWQLALSFHLIKTHGLRKTLEIFREGKEVSRQNAYIRKLQKEGKFWTHTHQEFIDAVAAAGFEIVEARKVFRGISDWVVARKL